MSRKIISSGLTKYCVLLNNQLSWRNFRVCYYVLKNTYAKSSVTTDGCNNCSLSLFFHFIRIAGLIKYFVLLNNQLSCRNFPVCYYVKNTYTKVQTLQLVVTIVPSSFRLYCCFSLDQIFLCWTINYRNGTSTCELLCKKTHTPKVQIL